VNLRPWSFLRADSTNVVPVTRRHDLPHMVASIVRGTARRFELPDLSDQGEEGLRGEELLKVG